jgi:formylglycine-generating enzyme required for sulfatase activity
MGIVHRGLGIAFVAITAAIIGTTIPALAEKRVALIVGNSAYKHVTRLENPANDAKLMAETLRALGFTLVGNGPQLDLDEPALKRVVRSFGDALTGADVALFYYAGHGVQVRGANFLVPVGANPVKEADVDIEMLDTNVVLRQMESAGTKLNLVILDACRNNPFGGRGLRSTGSGLAQIQAPQGTLISFATQPGAVALDGTGRNSPYTQALAAAIRKPGLDIFRTFNEVGLTVATATNGQQQPWVSLSPIKGDFYFGGAPAAPAVAAQVQTPPHVDAAERAGVVTQNTTSIAVLEDFVRQFGATPFGSMAKARLEELKKSQTAAAAVVVPPPLPAAAPKPTPAVVTPPIAPAVPPQAAPKPAVGIFSSSAPSAAAGVTPLAADRERALKPKDTFKECDACPDMIVVPAGNFMMGAAPAEGTAKYEGPQHRVTFAQPLAVGRFAVTFAEWDACVADRGCNGYKPDDKGWGRDRLPVIHVSWDDAKAYVAWLSKKTGKTYRLLSESEREYVTRAGTTTQYWTGKSISTAQANYDSGDSNYRRKTVPVDSFAPNPFGLFQVHGNVTEWLEDCHNDNYKGAPTDGSAWTSGYCIGRAQRGGPWWTGPLGIRSAARGHTLPDSRDHGNGFRVARSLAQ